MLAGRPHEAVSNGSPRWMAVGPLRRVHRTRPTGRLARRLSRRPVHPGQGAWMAYFRSGALPPVGTVCQQDLPPFAR